jgi:succinoglycan biosynthesis protein ExoL
MLDILYLAHDVTDPAIARRLLALKTGGARVTLAGFRRGDARPVDSDFIELGLTRDGRFGQRIAVVAMATAALRRKLRGIPAPDVILARNLEMLALANRANAIFGGRAAIVYECLDIHRLLLRRDAAGHALRAAEQYLGRNVRLLITSSPAFIENYFKPVSRLEAPVMLLENKVFEPEGVPNASMRALPPRPGESFRGEPFRIGWFGALRCRKSLQLLAKFTRLMEGRYEIVLRGRPAYSEFPDFDTFVENEPFMSFHGAYRNPDDLADIYSEVQFSWSIDFFEEGENSSWLLPNRLYEGCRYGAVPIAMAGTETARFIREKQIGLVLERDDGEALAGLMADMTPALYQAARDRVARVDPGTWTFGRTDCEALVSRLAALRGSVPTTGSIHAISQTTLSKGEQP